jgi:hypothetical protein
MNEDEIEYELEPEAGASNATRSFDGEAKARLALQMLKQTQQSLTHVIQLLEEGDTSRATRDMVNYVMGKKMFEQNLERETGARTVEGIFDGTFMVTSEGERHLVPENYASKSKLIEGDMLKLIIKTDGTHIYKQISPVERKRLVGVLGTDTVMNTPIVIVGADVYKVLTASVSYHKSVPGDEVVILVPGSGKSLWAALERVVGK